MGLSLFQAGCLLGTLILAVIGATFVKPVYVGVPCSDYTCQSERDQVIRGCLELQYLQLSEQTHPNTTQLALEYQSCLKRAGID